MIDKEYLTKLNEEASKIEPDNEVLYEENFNKRYAEFSKNLIETMNYIDTCNETELDWASECFDELFEHFKSQELIDCVERNITRFDNPELQQQLKMELEYMKMYL